MMNDAALGALTWVSPGGTGLRLAAALAARPRRSSHPSGTGGSPTRARREWRRGAL
jgi:hypothetical protein